VKLLFDANLSPRLTALLDDVFPGSTHVLDIGTLAADDLLIWNYARDNGLTIVSKDSDFHRMSFVLGAPPQVIWLRVGNCPTTLIERTLRDHLAEIDLFEKSEDAAFLIVDAPI
jgi:predicted nuclease of predicted toxin-antitoxin system